MSPERVQLLETDPDLLDGLDPSPAADARAAVVAPVHTVPAGPWRPKGDALGAVWGFGLVLIDGFLVRYVALGKRRCAELLGPGTILQPWVTDGEYAVAPLYAMWRVLEPVRLAVLDRQVSETLCRWPPVVRNLMVRVMERSRYLAGHLTLAHFPRIETRLLVLMWHLAERFGKVSRDGVVLELPVSHELIGDMVAARRPSVTTGFGHLEEQRLIVTRRRQEWLLLGEPPDELSALPFSLPKP